MQVILIRVGGYPLNGIWGPCNACVSVRVSHFKGMLSWQIHAEHAGMYIVLGYYAWRVPTNRRFNIPRFIKCHRECEAATIRYPHQRLHFLHNLRYFVSWGTPPQQTDNVHLRMCPCYLGALRGIILAKRISDRHVRHAGTRHARHASSVANLVDSSLPGGLVISM